MQTMAKVVGNLVCKSKIDLHLVQGDGVALTRRSVPAHPEHVAVYADADVGLGHPGELHPDHHLGLRLEDIHVRLPVITLEPVRELSVELGEGVAALGVAH